MNSHTILAANSLGEARACGCGGVHMRLAGTLVHVAAADMAKLYQLMGAVQAHGQKQCGSSATPSHAVVAPAHVPEMTPTEAARFGDEGPLRPMHAGPCGRTLH